MTKEELKERLGKRIVELRKAKGWSQADLARACGKDRQAMEKLENGKVNPTIYTLFEVAHGLGFSSARIMSFTVNDCSFRLGV